MALTQKQLDDRKRWRDNNREKVSQMGKEYYSRKKNDPEWYASHKLRAATRQENISNYDKALERGYYDEYWQAEQNYIRRLLNNAKYRAKQKGMPFNITIDDLPIPEVCPIYGIPIAIPSSDNRNAAKGCRSVPNAPSLDRIDSTKGYVKDNVQIISFIANQHKSNATLEEMILLGNWAKTQI